MFNIHNLYSLEKFEVKISHDIVWNTVENCGYFWKVFLIFFVALFSLLSLSTSLLSINLSTRLFNKLFYRLRGSMINLWIV